MGLLNAFALPEPPIEVAWYCIRFPLQRRSTFDFAGVYIIAHRQVDYVSALGRVPFRDLAIYVGSSEGGASCGAMARLWDHSDRQDILSYQVRPNDELVAWVAAVAPENALAVERYVANRLTPIVGERHPLEVAERPVNLPEVDWRAPLGNALGGRWRE